MTSSEPARDLAGPGPPRGKGSRRHVTIAVAVLAVALVGRIVSSGQGALEDGHLALREGNELGATVAYREAVSWYLPLVAPWRDEAADALWSLHDIQLAEARLPDAIRSLQSLRAGLRSGDSIVRPSAALKVKVDAVLAPLMAQWERDDARDAGRVVPGTLADRTAHHAAILAQDERPNRAWGLLAVLGFLVWVGAAVVGLRDDGPLRWRALGISAAGLVAFLAGVALA